MVRVRFAPSPTGYLHIGGARTALYNYLFARKMKGTFVLRVEDTDLERSKKEYEDLQIADLKWLGIEYDEGPDKPGKFGPYRQSERIDIYQKYARELVDKDLAYYDFCSDQELAEMKERAQAEGRPPHYDGKWRNPDFKEEAFARLAAGEKAAIRFRAPDKSYVLNDMVRGRVVYPVNMVGDFVILRSSGMPTYNYCCVVDDMEMEITHVIRGEDHLSNTVRQLMIYEALSAKIPEFAHVSLLIGKDRQKLSKRHGATSVHLYKEESYLPQALTNYLCLLGWSHPEEIDIFSNEDIIPLFDTNRFSKSPAIYDLEKLKWMNGQHLRNLSVDILREEALKVMPEGHEFLAQDQAWQNDCLKLFKDQINFFSELPGVVSEWVFSTDVENDEKSKEVKEWESTPKILEYIKQELKGMEDKFLSLDTFNKWLDYAKKDLGVKGKPLFMGMRFCLTGKTQGPELKDLLPLTPVSTVLKRVEKIK